MSLVVLGTNHHTAPIEVRERLAFRADSLPAALPELRECLGGASTVILSTCNRVEVYVHHGDPIPEICRGVRTFLSEFHEIPEQDFRSGLYEYGEGEAAGHLFRVAASLDSLVVGETQILGQVHDAYVAAQMAETTDKVINALFQRAFSVAKKVRSETAIGAGRVSVSSVAVDLAASIFGDLSGKTVLVIGSGETAELTLRSLVSRGVGKVLVMNRRIEKARALAAPYGGEPVSLESLDSELHRADIVISSTAAPHPILRRSTVWRGMRRRAQEPMFVIDIAVPRDVEPEVGELDNVYLYDIDDLEKVVAESVNARREEIRQGLQIVEVHVERFMEWRRGLVAEPAIVSMTEELEAIREEELQKTLAALPDLGEAERDEVRRLTERIVKHILARPMTHIKQEVGHHDPNIVLHLVRRLFGLDET